MEDVQEKWCITGMATIQTLAAFRRAVIIWCNIRDGLKIRKSKPASQSVRSRLHHSTWHQLRICHLSPSNYKLFSGDLDHPLRLVLIPYGCWMESRSQGPSLTIAKGNERFNFHSSLVRNLFLPSLLQQGVCIWQNSFGKKRESESTETY